MPKKLNKREEIGQRVIMWNRATNDGFVPALCVVCEQVKTVKRSTALVWRSNKDAPACCARTAPHLVKRIAELEKLVAVMNASDCEQMNAYEEELTAMRERITKLESAVAGAVRHMEAGDLYEAKVLLDKASQRTS